MSVKTTIGRIGIILGVWALLATPVFADTTADVRTFFSNTGYDVQSAASVDVTLRLVSATAYWYVDNRYWNTLTTIQQEQFSNALNQLAVQADTVIMPRARAFWGTENMPGIDGDPRVVVVLEQMKESIGGYFESIHNYTPTQTEKSNGREMIYVNVESVLVGSAKNFIAHEFQHLISFNQREILQKAGEDVWLNEARSEYDLTVVGYDEPFGDSVLERRAQAFVRSPSNSLVGWPNNTDDYAIASVFAHYLADRFGTDILTSPQHTALSGVAGINAWLGTHGGQTFSGVFTEWMVASFLNDQRLGAGYGYNRPGLNTLHVAPQQFIQLTPNEQYLKGVSVQEWQPIWMSVRLPRASTGQSLKIQVAAPNGAQAAGALIVHYQSGLSKVIPLVFSAGQATVSMPMQQASGDGLDAAVLAFTQGTTSALSTAPLAQVPMTVTALVGTTDLVTVTVAPTPTAPEPITVVKDGDLVSHQSEGEVYVVWGGYRRFLPAPVLELYGFQSRPVAPVSSDTFEHYRTTNYVRVQGDTKVYALWPDGTRHWLDITAAQWEASGRDWNAIFTINDRELAWYRLGTAITQ